MEHITIGDISSAVTLIVGFIGSVAFLRRTLRSWISKCLEEQFEAIDGQIKALQNKLDDVDMEGCKNFLVRCLADIDKGDQISETELSRFWEQYEYYKEHGGNTYISRRVEILENEGRL